jgi:alpha-amylase
LKQKNELFHFLGANACVFQIFVVSLHANLTKLKTMKKIILSVLSLLLLNAGILRAENVGVPSECEDVMLQTFYWDSYKLAKYGRTKWVDLLKDTTAITRDFDLVWFPPSAGPTGSGVGYSAKEYSKQEGDWGTKTTLTKLIGALHRGNTKVIADIVINHRGNMSNWCDFFTDNFGQYGTYTLTQQHICKYDEGFTDSKSSCYGADMSTRGAADTGTNFEGARDFDHTNAYVQNWAKAYVKWMFNIMKYDGFRYDMTRGYGGTYLSMYNQAANPYFSVSEFWMDNVNDQIAHLQDAEYNTLIFDFPLKGLLGRALGKDGSSGETLYNLLKKPDNSLRGKGYQRYAVTFIDNHDTFERSDNQGAEFVGYNVNLDNADVKRRIVEANAYILMMPGVPCVFWPHWKKYEQEISALIAVRKKAGLHSESAIAESSTASKGNRTYEATIVGHRGTVILRMGPSRSKVVPDGFALELEGQNGAEYSIYYSSTVQGIEEVSGEGFTGKKFLKDGKLYIRVGEKVYDTMGRMVE